MTGAVTAGSIFGAIAVSCANLAGLLHKRKWMLFCMHKRAQQEMNDHTIPLWPRVDHAIFRQWKKHIPGRVERELEPIPKMCYNFYQDVQNTPLSELSGRKKRLDSDNPK